jgi:hypothetical protein
VTRSSLMRKLYRTPRPSRFIIFVSDREHKHVIETKGELFDRGFFLRHGTYKEDSQTLLWWQAQVFNNTQQKTDPAIDTYHNMAASKILFITGGNTGLGFETVKALCDSQTSYKILLGSRSLDKANAAIAEAEKLYPNSKSTLTAVQVDVESDESISKAYESVSADYDHLDILINNAGKHVFRF